MPTIDEDDHKEAQRRGDGGGGGEPPGGGGSSSSKSKKDKKDKKERKKDKDDDGASKRPKKAKRDPAAAMIDDEAQEDHEAEAPAKKKSKTSDQARVKARLSKRVLIMFGQDRRQNGKADDPVRVFLAASVMKSDAEVQRGLQKEFLKLSSDEQERYFDMAAEDGDGGGDDDDDNDAENKDELDDARRAELEKKSKDSAWTLESVLAPRQQPTHFCHVCSSFLPAADSSLKGVQCSLCKSEEPIGNIVNIPVVSQWKPVVLAAKKNQKQTKFGAIMALFLRS